jgi:hypothetical protein
MNAGLSASLLASGQDQALVELIDELTAKLAAGKPVDAEAYARAHPEHAEQLRQLVPALRALHELANSAGRGPAQPRFRRGRLQEMISSAPWGISASCERWDGAAWGWCTRRSRSR